MKCDICKSEIEKTILGKIAGTYLKRKKHVICANCQKKLGEKQALARLGDK